MFPELQGDSLPTELLGKPFIKALSKKKKKKALSKYNLLFYLVICPFTEDVQVIVVLYKCICSSFFHC